MAVSIGLTADGHWKAGITELANAASVAGFSAIGIGIPSVTATTLAELQTAGLRCHELMALTITGNHEKTLSYAEKLAEAAATVKAEWVMTGFAVPVEGATAQVVSRCADMFREAGARMAVEFSVRGIVASIADALDVVELAGGTDQAGIVIDTWHFFRATSTWEQLEEVPLERIAYVQFNDGLAAISDDLGNETMNRRAFPGAGIFDLDRFASTLLARGWHGMVSVEVLNAELRNLPVADFAQRAYAATLPYWS
jgi:sugar phosphate isomerase/epimerase